MTATRPQMAFWTLVGANPKDMSTPLAGHDRCVDLLSGAVGRPLLPRDLCSAAVRYPEMISTGREVS